LEVNVSGFNSILHADPGRQKSLDASHVHLPYYQISTICIPLIVQEGTMKIEIEGTLLKMTPETNKEKDDLAKLWNMIVGCIRDNKKLVPVGQYTPGLKEVAMFNIE
jgi:hypothetical protein